MHEAKNEPTDITFAKNYTLSAAKLGQIVGYLILYNFLGALAFLCNHAKHTRLRLLILCIWCVTM